jgi:hypothetical protein
MENVDNTRLLELIDKMKEEKTMESQNSVIAEVLKSRFLCPVILESAPKGGGKIEIGKDTKIQFSIIKTKEGKNFLIAFTCDEEVNKWQKNKVQQSIIYTFEDYAMIATNNENLEGFVIDPMGRNIVFTKQMIKEIKENITRESVVEENTQVQLGVPKDYPEELDRKLKDLFLNITQVKKAYLLLMTKQEELSYLLVIDAQGNEKAYFNTIASAAIPFLNGMPLNMLPANTELGQKIAQDFTPIYVAE